MHSIYAVSRVFVACFYLVFALRADLLYMCIAKSAHMVEMHYIPLIFVASIVRYILLICVNRFSIGPAFPCLTHSRHKRMAY